MCDCLGRCVKNKPLHIVLVGWLVANSIVGSICIIDIGVYHVNISLNKYVNSIL